MAKRFRRRPPGAPTLGHHTARPALLGASLPAFRGWAELLRPARGRIGHERRRLERGAAGGSGSSEPSAKGLVLVGSGALSRGGALLRISAERGFAALRPHGSQAPQAPGWGRPPREWRGWGQSSCVGPMGLRVRPAGASRRGRIQSIVERHARRAPPWPSPWLRPDPGRSLEGPSGRSRAVSRGPRQRRPRPRPAGRGRTHAALPRARSSADSPGSSISARWSSRQAECAFSRPRRRGDRRRLVFRELRRTAPGPGWPSGTRRSALRRPRPWLAPADPRKPRADAREPPPAMGALELLDRLERGLLRQGDEVGLVTPPRPRSSMCAWTVERCPRRRDRGPGPRGRGEDRAVRLGGRILSPAERPCAAGWPLARPAHGEPRARLTRCGAGESSADPPRAPSGAVIAVRRSKGPRDRESARFRLEIQRRHGDWPPEAGPEGRPGAEAPRRSALRRRRTSSRPVPRRHAAALATPRGRRSARNRIGVHSPSPTPSRAPGGAARSVASPPRGSSCSPRRSGAGCYSDELGTARTGTLRAHRRAPGAALRRPGLRAPGRHRGFGRDEAGELPTVRDEVRRRARRHRSPRRGRHGGRRAELRVGPRQKESSTYQASSRRRRALGYRYNADGVAAVNGDAGGDLVAADGLGASVTRVLGSGATILASLGADLFRFVSTGDGMGRDQQCGRQHHPAALAARGRLIRRTAAPDRARLVYAVRSYERSVAPSRSTSPAGLSRPAVPRSAEERDGELPATPSRSGPQEWALYEAGQLSRVQSDQASRRSCPRTSSSSFRQRSPAGSLQGVPRSADQVDLTFEDDPRALDGGGAALPPDPRWQGRGGWPSRSRTGST